MTEQTSLTESMTSREEMLALARRISDARDLDCMDEPHLPEMTTHERDMIVRALAVAAPRSQVGKDAVKLKCPRCSFMAGESFFATTPEQRRDGENAEITGIKKAMEVVANMRQAESGMFDEKHSGQRGCDRSDALYDVYVAIRALIPQENQHG